MYYARIETDKQAKQQHDHGLKADARARLDKLAADKRKQSKA